MSSIRFFHAYKVSLVVLLGVSFAQVSFAEPWCSRGYRADSYGRGIEAGFRGGDLRPKLLEPVCYDMGVRRGQALPQDRNVHSCERDFDQGYERGFKASHLSAGSSCYNGGYSAGLAALRVGAREGNSELVGSRCVEEYRRGEKDAVERRVPVRPAQEPDATCYRAGHFDGGLAH